MVVAAVAALTFRDGSIPLGQSYCAQKPWARVAAERGAEARSDVNVRGLADHNGKLRRNMRYPDAFFTT